MRVDVSWHNRRRVYRRRRVGYRSALGIWCFMCGFLAALIAVAALMF